MGGNNRISFFDAIMLFFGNFFGFFTNFRAIISFVIYTILLSLITILFYVLPIVVKIIFFSSSIPPLYSNILYAFIYTAFLVVSSVLTIVLLDTFLIYLYENKVKHSDYLHSGILAWFSKINTLFGSLDWRSYIVDKLKFLLLLLSPYFLYNFLSLIASNLGPVAVLFCCFSIILQLVMLLFSILGIFIMYLYPFLFVFFELDYYKFKKYVSENYPIGDLFKWLFESKNLKLIFKFVLPQIVFILVLLLFIFIIYLVLSICGIIAVSEHTKVLYNNLDFSTLMTFILPSGLLIGVLCFAIILIVSSLISSAYLYSTVILSYELFNKQILNIKDKKNKQKKKTKSKKKK